MRRRIVYKSMLIALLALAVSDNLLGQKKAIISGYITDAGSGEALISATLQETNSHKWATTNSYGFYSMPLDTGSVSLLVSYVGYSPATYVFNLSSDTSVHFQLSDSLLLEEVVIHGTLAENIVQTTQMGHIHLPMEQVMDLPSLAGEIDVMKVIQLMPGVQAGNEGSSGINVRGGSNDQNLILLDGVPLYNVFHLFGMLSVFNADAINHVELVKGGFPARYGGRLSSVLDVSMKEGNKHELKGTAGLGIVSARVSLEGPVVKGKSSFFVSARRSLLDIFTRPISYWASNKKSSFGYYLQDFNTKFNHKINNKNRIYISAYTGRDKATLKAKRNDITSLAGISWGNLIGNFRWNHQFSSQLFLNTSFYYSRYSFNLFFKETSMLGEVGTISLSEYWSGIEDYSIKADFDYIPHAKHNLKFGLQSIYHDFTPGVNSIKQGVALDTLTGTAHDYAHESVLYFEDDFQITSRWKVNLGIHSSYFNNQKFYYTIQPRVSARYLTHNDLAVKASYAEMAQYIHLLTNSGLGFPSDLWVPSTDRILPERSRQLAVGVSKIIKNSYEVSVETYYKAMTNLIEYKEGAGFLESTEKWDNKVETGDGTSYGAEFFVHRKVGKLSGWVGYTWSKTMRQFDNLNHGIAFPYKYDRRHNFNLAGVYKFGEELSLANNGNISIGFAWVYGTGNAITLPIAKYPTLEDVSENLSKSFASGSPANNFEERNSFRMKAYHRLDVDISMKKEKKWGTAEWNMGVINLLNRKNPYFLYYGPSFFEIEEDNDKKLRQVNSLPLFLYVSYSISF